MSSRKLSKVVIPVAGLGSRFLPATKSLPKELLPIVSTPIIHYIVQEAVDAGLETIVFVTSRPKVLIEDYFDPGDLTSLRLAKAHKDHLIDQVVDLSKKIHIVSVRQYEPLGLGHAILQASPVVSGQNFAGLDENMHQCVVPVTLRIIEADTVPLSELIAFRKREARSGGDDLRRLRQRYRARMEDQIEAFTGVTLASDRRELQRTFEIEMRDDLADLKAELRLSRREAMSSKEVIFLGLATLTAGIASAKGLHIPLEQVSMAGSVPVLGGVFNAHSKYAQARRTIIARHPMAYMLEFGG